MRLSAHRLAAAGSAGMGGPPLRRRRRPLHRVALCRGVLRHFLPLLALFSLLGLAVVLCHRWLAQARLLPLLAPDRPVSVTLTIEKAVQRGAYRRYSGRAVLESDAAAPQPRRW